jgi:Type IIA topoisomerase (DNA gyrase/topo II, topoisomerase IV), A subunit
MAACCPGACPWRVLSEGARRDRRAHQSKGENGKKSLSPEQQQTKQLMLSQLESVRDESGKDAAVRLVFEPRTAKVDRDEFVRLLLVNTSLQSSVSMNLVAVDQHGRPRSLSVVEVLGQWVSFRTETVRRRSAHRLAQAERRIHILEGRSIALLRIDEVIVVIRQSDEPKPALIARFGLTDLQAEDILEIRLRQLARLEAIKIERELSDLREQAGRLQGPLGERKDTSQGRLRRGSRGCEALR